MSIVKQAREDLLAAVQAIPAIAALTDTDFEASIPPTVDERKKISQRLVSVFIEQRKSEKRSRGCEDTTLIAWIVVLDPLIQGSEATIEEANNLLVDALFDELLGEPLGGTLKLTCTAIEQPAVLGSKHWLEYRQFGTFIKVTLER